MRIETKYLLDQLGTIPWFQRTGALVESHVLRAKSWAEAGRLCTTSEWESVQFQVRNCLSFCVNRTDYARFAQWNDVVSEINRLLEPIIEKHVKPIAQRERLEKGFSDGVGWDLMMACIETEYSDICPPIFFLNDVLPWYRKGHYPCGWDGPELQPGWRGPMPEGRLIVF